MQLDSAATLCSMQSYTKLLVTVCLLIKLLTVSRKTSVVYLQIKIGTKSKSPEVKCSIKMSVPVNITVNVKNYEFAMEKFSMPYLKGQITKRSNCCHPILNISKRTRVLSVSKTQKNDDERTFECLTCQRKIKNSKMRKHIAGHFACCGNQAYIKWSLHESAFVVFHWSYAMKKHYEDKHPESVLTGTTFHCTKLSFHPFVNWFSVPILFDLIHEKGNGWGCRKPNLCMLDHFVIIYDDH